MSEHVRDPDTKVEADAPVRPHDFDGIQELDNPMPNWWLALFIASIAFAFGYWAVLHRYAEETDPGRELSARMEKAAQDAARKAGILNNGILWNMSRDAGVVRAGREVYAISCAPCHLADLAGAIGPNLKDSVWIHGGQPMDIVKVITEGVAAKGMPTWGPLLGRQKIAEVAAFILSVHQPPNAPAQ
jgi:cytochrome c oxidase cbb3-type subunit 3